MIRDAERADIPGLVSLASQLVRDFMQLRPDRSKINEFIVRALSSNKNKFLVSASAGEITGMMVTLSDRFDIAEKMYAHIRCLYSEDPGDSRKMLEATMEWAESRRAIQMVCYSAPVQTGVDKLLLEHKFESTGSMLVWRRYGTV